MQDVQEMITTLRAKAAGYKQAAERKLADVHANLGAAQACESMISELTQMAAANGDGKRPALKVKET